MNEGAPQTKRNEESKIILPEVESHPRAKLRKTVEQLLAQAKKDIKEERASKKVVEGESDTEKLKKLKKVKKERTTKKEVKSESDTEKLKRLKKEKEELGEEYELKTEVTDKALAYSRWREAVKKYIDMEEELKLGLPENFTEADFLARLHELKRLMDGAGEKYKLETEVTDKALAESQWEEAIKKYREMEELMDLLNSHKKEDVKQQEEKSPEPPPPTPEPVEPTPEPEPGPELPPEPTPPTPEPTPPTPEPEPGPVPPEPKPKPPVISLEEINRIAIVDAQAIVEARAHLRGGQIFTEKLKNESRLKGMWMHMWETEYRRQFSNEEKKKMLGQENLPGFIRRKLFGSKTFEATGEKNLFAGTIGEGDSDVERQAVATRFAEGLHQESEGEEKRQLDDPEFSTKIDDLIFEYASGVMPDAEFVARKEILVDEIRAKYPDAFAEGGLTADNILERAHNFRIFKHSAALARTDVHLSIDLGKAKQALKTKANLTWADKIVNTSQKYLGPAVSPEAVGFGVAIGSFFAKKPLYWLGGAAGLGGLVGLMRRNVEQQRDLEMHRTERAMGMRAPGPDEERREGAERFVYEMRKATDVIDEVRGLSQMFNTDPSRENAGALMVALADAEARQSISGMRHADLVSFSGETSLERGRLEFLQVLAEGKTSLKKKGFEIDIKDTEAYKSTMERLGGEMDKIDSSERTHRWTENSKAAVTGAIGGLLVGGLVQEGLAFAGDHIDVLHWLRPGGKATSAETLYHYLKGDLLVGPTGASLNPALGFPNSSGGVVNIDATTELIQDKTTGLMALVDKADHSNILAKVNIDSVGHVTPVPGSYDPAIIHFNETKVGGGQQTLGAWINSMRGQFGGNVEEDVWHTKGFLDNDTLSKSDFNELKLLMSYDKAGNLTIDASKLQEFAQNAMGEQTGGSKHGAHALDVAKEFAKGTIKIGLAPDGSNQSSVLEFKLDPITHHFTGPNGTHIQDFFEADAKGHPVLKGDGVLGIIHQIGAQPDGSKNVEWVNAIRGNGHPIETGDTTRVITEINREHDQSWWGPWIWNFRRKPLEETNKNGGIIDSEGNPFEYEPAGFEFIPKEGEEIEGKTVKKKTVDTRGQKIESDIKDWEKEYPVTFPLKNEQEMAEFLVSNGRFLMSSADRRHYMTLPPEERVPFLANRITEDRSALDIGHGEKIPQETVEKIIGMVLTQVEKTFVSYSEEHSLLSAKEKIHVVGILEYQAQTKRSNTGELGVCFTSAGEIFINAEIIANTVREQGGDVDEIVAQIKRTVAHEVTHGSVANNYWMFELEQGETVPEIRRTGLSFVRVQETGGKTMVVERGRALNEAITEELARKVTDSIYKTEEMQTPLDKSRVYMPERSVLEMLQKEFDIPFEDFAKAVINRKALRPLAEKLNGKPSKAEIEKAEGKIDSKVARPQFMSLLLSIMDFESEQRKYTYDATKQFIAGNKGIFISKQMKKSFASNLLDRSGAIKRSLVEKYHLIDEEEALKMPIAA